MLILIYNVEYRRTVFMLHLFYETFDEQLQLSTIVLGINGDDIVGTKVF